MLINELFKTPMLKEINPHPDYDNSRDYIPSPGSYSSATRGVRDQIIASAMPFITGFKISLIPGKHRVTEKYAYVSTDTTKELIAYVCYDKTNTIQIKDVYVIKMARGNRLAINIYKWLMKHYNCPLQSDTEQTKNGQQIWVNLFNEPDIKVVGYIDIDKDKSKEYKDQIKNLQGKLYASSNDQDRYLVPVNIEKNMLQFASSKLFKLYSGSNQNIADAGLMAFFKE